MALDVSRVTVYASSIEDKPGGLAAKLEALAATGANLEFVIARRAPEKPGTGVVFIAGLQGGSQAQAATAAGFDSTESLHSVRVAGPDAPGLGAKITSALGDVGVNLRGLSAASIGDQCVVYLAVDTATDADKAIAVLGGI